MAISQVEASRIFNREWQLPTHYTPSPPLSRFPPLEKEPHQPPPHIGTVEFTGQPHETSTGATVPESRIAFPVVGAEEGRYYALKMSVPGEIIQGIPQHARKEIKPEKTMSHLPEWEIYSGQLQDVVFIPKAS